MSTQPQPRRPGISTRCAMFVPILGLTGALQVCKLVSLSLLPYLTDLPHYPLFHFFCHLILSD